MREDEHWHVTLDFTLAPTTQVLAESLQCVFCFVSGAGTDGSGSVQTYRVAARHPWFLRSGARARSRIDLAPCERLSPVQQRMSKEELPCIQ
jgi:hypothetical protein